FAQGSCRRRNAARRGVHPVLLLRGGRESADESGARSIRQDPGVQVLRGERDAGRSRKRRSRLRRRRVVGGNIGTNTGKKNARRFCGRLHHRLPSGTKLGGITMATSKVSIAALAAVSCALAFSAPAF